MKFVKAGPTLFKFRFYYSLIRALLVSFVLLLVNSEHLRVSFVLLLVNSEHLLVNSSDIWNGSFYITYVKQSLR
ncbi:hypothetical protein Q8G35_22105 [Peribacillus simplex]|uniref:Uncharacterized protein n=2 Tax=Peribacillus TaxID=2675229 RepID=A0AA90SWT8_9BACI|nr:MULTISPECIES: hypothetical protein [Peribacillus]MDP1420998.1 hypothetical protein [Peribacillus simplex]MDP1452445.1 hypothetical protein [Peribacillus frigoritolerans]